MGDFMKKKKLTFNSLALGNLKHRRKRYILMILGIILSMVFSSSIIYGVYSVFSISEERQKTEFGLYDAFTHQYNEKVFNDAKLDGAFEQMGYGSSLGFAFTDENDKLQGSSVARLDDNAKVLVNPIFEKGGYPKKAGEIAIEKTTLLQLGINAEIGDTVKLKFQVQNGEGTVKNIIEKSYVLSGIMEDKRANIAMGLDEKKNIPSMFVSDFEKIDAGGKENTLVYYTYAKNGYGIMQDTEEKYGVYLEKEVITDNAVILNGDETSIMMSMGVVVVILLLASSVGIINSFTTNLKERKKQIGLYRAVGATQRQIRKLFGREALLLSVICTPLSLVISYVTVKIILGRIFESVYFKPNIWVLLACGVFGVACVMGASLIPLVSASRISPMQAIRNVEASRKLKNKKVKSQINYNVPKLIAKRNMVISKGKLVVVSVFLSVTIVTACFSVSYLECARRELRGVSSDYELFLQRDSMYYAINFPEGNNGFTENDKQAVLMNENIADASGVKVALVNILVDKMTDYQQLVCAGYTQTGNVDEVNESNYKSIFTEKSQEDLDIIQLAGYSGDFLNCTIIGIEESEFEKQDLLKDLDIDISKLNSGEQVIVNAPKKIYLTANSSEIGDYITTYRQISHIENIKDAVTRIITEKECDFKVGDSLELSVLFSENLNTQYDLTGDTNINKEDLEVNNRQTEIAAVIDGTIAEHVSGGTDITIVTTVEGIEKFFPRAKYKSITFNLKDEGTEEIDAEITDLLDKIAKTVDSGYYFSNYEYIAECKQTYTNLTLLIYALVILLFTISGSIVNNTISSSIKEDKKKIGTLRAVGANEREITKSYIIRLLSMFKWGMGIGFGTFFGIYGLLVLTNDTLGYANVFVFNPWVIILVAFIMFAICSLSVYTKIKREVKNSIVENIREL